MKQLNSEDRTCYTTRSQNGDNKCTFTWVADVDGITPNAGFWDVECRCKDGYQCCEPEEPGDMGDPPRIEPCVQIPDDDPADPMVWRSK